MIVLWLVKVLSQLVNISLLFIIRKSDWKLRRWGRGEYVPGRGMDGQGAAVSAVYLCCRLVPGEDMLGTQPSPPAFPMISTLLGWHHLRVFGVIAPSSTYKSNLCWWEDGCGFWGVWVGFSLKGYLRYFWIFPLKEEALWDFISILKRWAMHPVSVSVLGGKTLQEGVSFNSYVGLSTTGCCWGSSGTVVLV